MVLSSLSENEKEVLVRTRTSLYNHTKDMTTTSGDITGKDDSAGNGILGGKKILLVDDAAWVFEQYTEPLMDVTDGNALFLLHAGLNQNQLVEKILSMKPEIILIDAQLDAGVEGPELTRVLMHRNPEFQCIGFSNDLSYKPAFVSAGAISAVKKRYGDPWNSLQEIAMIFSRK